MSAEAAFAYHLLRAALERFGRRPFELSPPELDEARALAARTLFLEERVLASDEAARVGAAREASAAALAELAARYEDEAAFRAEIAAAGLSEAALGRALERQSRMEAVLDAVATAARAPTDDEIAAFYERRPDRFHAPERRDARHLLVTVNADFPENAPRAARARIDAIRARLRRAPERFADEAAAHSECPTALRGGAMGPVARGLLSPALEQALFALPAGGLSAVIETEIGLHLLLCEAVTPARRVSLEEARPQIVQALTAALAEQTRRAWIRTVCARRPAASSAPRRATRTQEQTRCAS